MIIKNPVKISTGSYIEPAIRSIDLTVTREGVISADIKEVAVLDNIFDRNTLITLPVYGGVARFSFIPDYIDGYRVLLTNDYHATDPYLNARHININQNLKLNIDLNDGTGGSGPSFPEGSSKVRGTVQNLDGTPAEGKNIYAYHRDSGAFLAKGVLPQDGKFDLHLPTPPIEKILLVAVDPDNEQSPPVLDYVIPEEV